MTSARMKKDLENIELAMKYRPLLILYPEIASGSNRKDHHHRGHRLGGPPPLDQDYHPRDIRLVLDHARLPGRSERPSRDELLEAMSENRVDYIDIIDDGGPKDSNKFWSTYADVENKDGNPEYQRKTYARIVKGLGRFKDYISIQYWLAYFYDDWANVHEMDWEMVSLILKKTDSTEEPVACVFNAHMGSYRKPWADVQKVDETGSKNPQGLHPVTYVANGSHASYFSNYPSDFHLAENIISPMLRLVIHIANIGKEFTDYVPSVREGVKCFPNVEVIPESDRFGRWSGDWRWLNFKGRWGSPVRLSLKERLIAQIPVLRTISKIFER